MKNFLNSKKLGRLVSFLLVLTFIAALAVSAGCSLDEKEPEATEEPVSTEQPSQTTTKTEGNPIVIESPALDFTLYDFRQAYYSNQNYMYMMYGMLSPADYFDIVVDDAKNFLYVYNAAVENGVELDSDELLEVTPKSLRIRKKILDPTLRKRAGFRKE